MFKTLITATLLAAALAGGEEDKQKALLMEKLKAEQAAQIETATKQRPDKPEGERPDFVVPEIIQKVPACPSGLKRVSKGKQQTRALMNICGGGCIGRSPGAKEWIAEDLPFYDHQQVGTKNIGRPPHWVTYTEFLYECEDANHAVQSSFSHIVESKQFIDAKDWSRAEINEWLDSQRIYMTHLKDTQAIKEDLGNRFDPRQDSRPGRR